MNKENTFHNTDFTTPSASMSIPKPFCLELCTAKRIVVSEWITPGNPQSFFCLGINTFLNFGATMIFQIFTLLSFKFQRKWHFFVFFSQNIRRFTLQPEFLEANCKLNFPSSRKIRAFFMYVKVLIL